MEGILEKETKEFTKKYEQYKSIVVKWEVAFSKEKGKPPTKDDFSLAPRSVRHAYCTYLEVKQLLSKLSSSVGQGKGFENQSKRKPVDTPGRIFRGRSSQGPCEEFNPPQKLRWNSSMEGITPLSPPTKKPRPIRVPPEMAAIPIFKNFMTPRSKKKSTGDIPKGFGRLTSKLFVQEIETESVPVPIGTGMAGGSSEDEEEEEQHKDSEFPIEIEKILMDVRRAVENFDKEEFDDDGTSSQVSDLPSFIFTPLSVPPVVTVPEIDTPDGAKVKNKLGFFAKRSSTKPRAVSGGWIDRCHFVAGDQNLLPSEDASSDDGEGPPQDEQCNSDSAILSNGDATPIPMDVEMPSVENLQITPLGSSLSSIPLKLPKISRENAVPVTPTENTETRRQTRSAGKVKSPVAEVAVSETRKKKPRKVNVKMPTEPKLPAPKRKAEEITDFDFLDVETGKAKKGKGRKRIRLTTQAAREKNMNDNFVRVDVTKKVFVRGRKKMTGFQHKKLDWKLKKSQAAAEHKIQLMKCRKCGEVGHLAKFCVKELEKQSELKPEEVDDSPFPSLQEVARMIWSKKATEASQTRTCIYEGSKFEQVEVEVKEEVGPEAEATTSTSAQTSTNENEDEEYEAKLVLVSHEDDDADSETANDFSPGSQPLDTSTSELNQSGSSDSNSFLLTGTGGAASSQPLVELSSLTTPAFPNASLGPEDEEMLQEALQLFGYKDFRPGQKEAITRVLLGQTTLVVLSTGSGKSLCYLLPAYIYAKKYPGVLTICVSPLVSLMEDQVQSIPPFLQGACLHTNMSRKHRELVIEKIRQKKLQVLLVSPEAICGGMFGLLRNVHEFPTVAFACVDEVHCVSEWSHNFRPSYLRLCQILRDRLKVKTILGLTATATNHTIKSVCDHLCLDPSTVVRGEIIPVNLRLSCSRDMNREEALISLLRSKRFEECDSIIIYCTRREQCERIATLIRTTHHTQFSAIIKESSRRRISTDCETYHAGMTAARRRSVQNLFMAGKIRIVVATVAFGMGIDKSNIRAVIHYNMPKTFESFVQEIGRAGRDGLPAECHLFLDSNKGKDICELKRHIYSNSVDRSTIRKLLSRIFKPCTCHRTVKMKGIPGGGGGDQEENEDKKPCPGHEVSFSTESTVRDLDLPDENIETLLCYLERYSTNKKLIEVLPKCYHLCSIQSYGGTNLLKTSARSCAALGAAIAMQKEKKKFKDDDVHVSFNFVEVARLLGWSSTQMRKELKSLEWTGTQFDQSGNPIRFRKSGLLIEFSDLAYRMMTPGTLSDEESDKILNFLHERNMDQERLELFQLNRVYQSLFSNSCTSVESICVSYDEPKSDNLKKLILEYFSVADVAVPVGWKPPISGSNAEKEETVRQDVRRLLQSHQDNEFSSRSIARIFQGISSPRFPAEDWCRNRAFWRRHIDVDFPFLCQIAAQELIC